MKRGFDFQKDKPVTKTEISAINLWIKGEKDYEIAFDYHHAGIICINNISDALIKISFEGKQGSVELKKDQMFQVYREKFHLIKLYYNDIDVSSFVKKLFIVYKIPIVPLEPKGNNTTE